MVVGQGDSQTHINEAVQDLRDGDCIDKMPSLHPRILHRMCHDTSPRPTRVSKPLFALLAPGSLQYHTIRHTCAQAQVSSFFLRVSSYTINGLAVTKYAKLVPAAYDFLL